MEFHDFKQAFEIMISAADVHRNKNSNLLYEYYDIEFKLEFCVIELNVPRFCGKSKFITEYSKTYNSLVITRNNITAEEYLKMGINATTSSLMKRVGSRYIRKYKYIFLDEVNFSTLRIEQKSMILDHIDADSGLIVSLYTGLYGEKNE
jgi:hypothetical protein